MLNDHTIPEAANGQESADSLLTAAEHLEKTKKSALGYRIPLPESGKRVLRGIDREKTGQAAPVGFPHDHPAPGLAESGKEETEARAEMEARARKLSNSLLGKTGLTPPAGPEDLAAPDIPPFRKPLEIIPKGSIPVKEGIPAVLPKAIQGPPPPAATIQVKIGLDKAGMAVTFSKSTDILRFDRNSAIGFAKGMLRAAKRMP